MCNPEHMLKVFNTLNGGLPGRGYIMCRDLKLYEVEPGRMFSPRSIRVLIGAIDYSLPRYQVVPEKGCYRCVRVFSGNTAAYDMVVKT